MRGVTHAALKLSLSISLSLSLRAPCVGYLILSQIAHASVIIFKLDLNTADL